MLKVQKKRKPLTKAEREKIKRVVEMKRKYIRDHEKKMKREGQKIPRRLKHQGIIKNYETVDGIAKARRGRVLDNRDEKSITGQYFRTGLAREETMKNKEPKILDKTQAVYPSQEEMNRVREHGLQTAVNKSIERPSTDVNKTRNERLISVAHRPPPPPHPVKTLRKLGKSPIRSKTQSRESYKDIRNRFELASGGINLLEDKELISPQYDELTLSKPAAIKPTPKPKTPPSIRNTALENIQRREKETVNEREKPHKIRGVKLVGLGSKAEKTIGQPSEVTRVKMITRKQVKKPKIRRENMSMKNEVENIELKNKVKANKMDSDPPFGKDGMLVARRIRKLPGKNFKKHDFILEEIYEMPPVTARKDELKSRFPEKNLKKFAELGQKYRCFNGVVTLRKTLTKCAKFVRKTCGKIFANIRNILKNRDKARKEKL